MKQTTFTRLNRLFAKRTLMLLVAATAFCFSALAQDRVVSGNITDAGGIALPGVNVSVKGTTIGVVSDIDGKFSIRIPGNDAILLITYVGYKNREIQVGQQNSINVTMEEDVQLMDEIVVVGYGVQKKKLVTGATLNLGGDEIQALKTNSPMEALKGISPGLSITQNNGVPGSGSKVSIRGIGTIGDSKPLYVVDGIQVGDIDFLSPSDIESIDVLKDAASAAIYGSRAANGVILVTTKKGKKDARPQISYDMYWGRQSIYKKLDMLDAQQYIEIMNEANANSKTPAHKWNTLVPYFSKYDSGLWKGTNWVDEIENKDAQTQSHALNIVGSTGKSSYSIGGSYYSEDGVLGRQVNSTYKRISLRLNTENVIFEKNGNDILIFGENINYTNTKKPTLRTGNIYWNDLHNMLIASPLLPMWAKDPALNDSVGTYHRAIDWNPNEANPVALMEYNGKYNTNNNNSIVANAYLELQPIKRLKIRSSYGINSWYGNSRQWTPAYDIGPKNSAPRDQINQSMYSGSTWTNTNTASYNTQLGDHNISVLAGNEMQKNTSSLDLSGHNENSLFQDEEHAYLTNVKQIDATYTTLSGKDSYGWGMMSYFGRLSYDYKETYMLTLVLRADGSSNFPIGYRWGTFPSISGGWVASNETFMDNTKGWLNMLKLRGSWGQNGNQNIDKFQYLSSLSYDDANYFFGTDKTLRTIGSWPARVPNFELTWETSEQLNFGADIFMFRNQLQFTIDWYRKDTRDWLVKPDQPKIWGTNPPFVNGGYISNKGLELVARWNQRDGEFKYGVTASLAQNQNKIEEIQNSEKIFHGQSNVLSQGTSEIYRAQQGYPIGYFWGYKTAGILQDSIDVANYVAPDGTPYFPKAQPGDVRFVDTNMDSVINEKDKVMIGNPNPDFIFGLQLDAEFKGFYVQATANGATGHQIANSFRFFNDGTRGNVTTDVYNRWHGKGTSDKFPRILAGSHSNSTYVSDLYIEDGDYLRISTITCGVDLKYYLKQMPLTEMKLYFTIKNLHTFTNYSGMDPEVGYAPDSWASGVDLGLYPLSQSYMIGLSVKF